ncbi:hypothetical protein AZE42_03741 [Rhizopogon vesiculosus]|uniref:DUF6534 domain-containing protein n=1 Tax=Rhizopogon vesiculosus TaxID=180088 RepID=A0A1J8QBP0_9AGAM|nr:hypothetical protein AZE42_03741 [Rhizopogon vesiculosus]
MNNTFGALYIGTVAGAILFGLGTVQVFIYFQNQKGSGLNFYRLAVCWLWFFNALHVYAVNHAIYHYLITNYGNPLALSEVVWSVKVLLLVDALIVYTYTCSGYGHLTSGEPELYQRLCLFGLSNMQVFIYFQTHKGSGFTPYKFAVCWLWVLDALHVCAMIRTIYYYLITNYGNSHILAEMVWSLKTVIIVDALNVYSVHLLYLERIWIAIGIVLSWETLKHQLFVDLPGIQWSIYLNLARTGFTKPDMTLLTLIRDAINTGCLTGICSAACIITKALMPEKFIFVGMELLLAKLYVNSYLALLNTRYYHESDGATHVLQRLSSHVYRPECQVNVSHYGSSRTSKADQFQVADSGSAPEHPPIHHVMVRSKTSNSAYIG